MNARRPIPLRPDRSAPDREWLVSFVRASTARVLSRIQKTSADAIMREHWADDSLGGLILRSPVEPLKQSDLPGDSVAALMLLAPQSAAVRLFELATKVDLSGISSFSFPLPSSFGEAVFVGEGMPIPVTQGTFAGMPLGPVRKVALIAALTNELENTSAPVASVIISHVLKITVGNGLAKVLFSADPASDIAPAGLLFDVTPLTAGASMSEDLAALVASIAAAGVDAESVVFIAAAAEAMKIKLSAGPHFNHGVISANIDPGTVIAIAADGFAVAGEGTPVVDASRQAVLHVANPAEMISTGGSPNAVGAPTVSTFQIDSIALRCIARMTWSAAPGAVAWIENVTW